MPKNVRIIERLTGKDELTGMPIYTPVDVKDLNTLNSEDYIRIWDSKEAKDNQDRPVLEGFLLRTPWVDENDGTASFDIETAAERDKRLEQEKIAAFKARQAEMAKFDDPRFIGLLRGEEALAALNDALNDIENSKEAL